MRHTCEHCATRYEIPDDRVAGRFLKVRCKRCRATMHVVGLRPLDAAAKDGAVWWCAIFGTPHGPYREDEVASLVASGDIHARTRMWCAGMRAWERVCESPTLAWVYGDVIARATTDPRMRGIENVFDRAALLSDGAGYFPDPTLKSGIVVLDDDAQRDLARLAARQAKRPRVSWLAPLFAAAAGLGMAVGGVGWFMLGA
ncbi:MAG: zinc-ribbon domain-containing protein [Deltaproteobacteria bacterium]|nr:zinc-ribbon domain-containing protein [Deltaproteobacteria bacterium]